jgi:hypothetical protein
MEWPSNSTSDCSVPPIPRNTRLAFCVRLNPAPAEAAAFPARPESPPQDGLYLREGYQGTPIVMHR